MNKQLLFVSLVCMSLGVWQAAQAADIQLRPDDPSEIAGGANPVQQNSAPNRNENPGMPDTSNMTTEQRLARLERILNSQGLESMLVRMDSLQNQIEKLRGDIEVQAHQLDELKQRQRDLYVDIDRRLVKLERNSQGGNAGGATVTSPSATTSSSMPSTQTHTAAASTNTKAPAPVDSAGEQQAYQKAFNTLRDLRYAQAVKAFKAFLAKYPKGRYAHIAQYWIGEADYAQRKYKLAIVEYQTLIDNYPNSPKLAEAMLKIGYSQYALKNNKSATVILKQLIKSYPGTTEAGQAQNLLQKIRLNK